MIIYRIKHKEFGMTCATLLDKNKAMDRLFEANAGVFKKAGWPKGDYIMEILELEREILDNERLF